MTSANSILSGIYSIRKVVINGMPDVTDMDYMFDDCEYLESIYISNLPNVETMYETFEYCYALKTVVIGDCPNLTDTSYTFYDCEALQTVQFGATPALDYVYGMFEYCYSLLQGPELDMSNVTDAGEMFYECYSLKTVPDYDTPLLQDVSYMFEYCYSLTEAPNLNTSLVEGFYEMFYECLTMVKVPAYDFSSNTGSLNSTFYYCTVLQLAPITGVSDDIYFANCLLGRAAIVEIFNGLADAGATIDLTGNYGTNDLTPGDIAIAEDKGWTVTY